MGDFTLRIKNHFRFSHEERLGFLYTVLAAAFILSFRKWGTVEFDWVQGISNMILCGIIFLVCLFVHIATQKLISIRMGFSAKYTYSRNGIFVGVLMAFLSYGYIPVLMNGSIELDSITRLRLGRFRYGLNMKDLAKVAFAGPASNIVITLILEPFFAIAPAGSSAYDLLMLIVWTNFLIAIYALLPFKNCSGLHIFIASRGTYVLAFFFVLLFFIFALLTTTFSLIISAVLALVIAITYATIVEKPST